MSTPPLPFQDVEIPIKVEGNGPVLIVLAHSAGGNMDSPLLSRLASRLVADGHRVARFNFPYRVKGKNMPDRMPVAMDCFKQVAQSLRGQAKLVIGGHSFGGRAASMLAADGFPTDGLVLLGYPLHPAGQPEKLRDAHLPSISCPTLCVNGTRDDLCTKELMDEVLTRVPPSFEMVWLDSVDHSLKPVNKSAGTQDEVDARVTSAIGELLARTA